MTFIFSGEVKDVYFMSGKDKRCCINVRVKTQASTQLPFKKG